MKRLILIASLLLCFLTGSNAQSIVYIHTDRDIYQAGEQLNFKAYTNLESALAAAFTLNTYLIDQNGAVVVENDFLISGISHSATIDLPGSLVEGEYTLVAKFSNATLDESFRKNILIHELLIPTVLFSIHELKSQYSSGEEVEVSVGLRSPNGLGLKKTSFYYRVLSNGIEVQTGKGKTNKLGDDIITFTYPDVDGNDLVSFECYVEQSGNVFTNGIIIPSKELPLLISFYPEGGLLIDGYEYRVGFSAHNLYGERISIEGELIGPKNQLIETIKTSVPGFGEFKVMADARIPLRLNVIEPAGIERKIDLPRIQSNGVVLRHLETDNRNIKFNLVNPIEDTYMSLVASAEQSGQLFYSKKLLVQEEKEFSVPIDSCHTGIVRININNGRGELIAQRSVFYWGDKYNIPMYPNSSMSIVDEVFSPAWKPGLKLGEWLNLGPELANEQINPLVLETYMLTAISENFTDTVSKTPEEYKAKIIEHYFRITELDQYISSLNQTRFFNSHFLSSELGFGRFYSENAFELDEMGFIPKKLSQDERVRRQLDQGKSVLSVIRSIRAYKIINNQLVFRNATDSFNDPGGSVIVIDGVTKGADIQVLQNLSPFDVASIKVSTSVSDIMKYAGMEDTAGVVVIETRQAAGETVKQVVGPSSVYTPTLYWNPEYIDGEDIQLKERKLKSKTRKNKA